MSFYEQRFAGEISSRIHLNDRLAQVLSGELATTAISAVMVVFYMLVMVQYNALLSGIGIAAVALNLIALQLVSRWRVDANLGLIQEQGKVSGVAISGLQSMETLKASGLESDFFARWSGQCQRLEIARALVNNPAILILDEATSALDSETEQIIDRNIRQRNCTCLIVAHRLSTIRDCDEIIVLDQGQVVQRGTHDRLKNEAGVYP